MANPTNAQIASVLDRVAELLETKGENPFRVRSYRTAAEAIRGTRKKLAEIAQRSGVEGLTEIKGVGEKLAGLIVEYVSAGAVELLADLEKEAQKIPTAAKNAGGAAKTPAKRAPKKKVSVSIDVDRVLAIDRDYREKAAAGKLKMIAPRRLNPEKKAWLPLMVREEGGYRFTVMYSNTERAHELGKTQDWVVVYYEKGEGEDQCTVVTEARGALKGKRVIRGREADCAAFYGSRKT